LLAATLYQGNPDRNNKLQVNSKTYLICNPGEPRGAYAVTDTFRRLQKSTSLVCCR